MRLLGPIDEGKDVINVDYLEENAAINKSSDPLEVYVQDTEPTPEEGKNKLWVHALPVKTYTDLIADSGTNNEAGCAFYFGSIRPTSFTETWEVRYRVRSWVPGNTNYEAISEVYFTGDQASINAYAIFNHIYSTSYKPLGYHCVHRLKQAGYTAGYGHAIGVNLQDANNRDNTSLKRSVFVEVIYQNHCTVTLNDTAVKWANWTGTGTTNYNDIGNYNFSSNGLQETGDNNDIGILRSYYERPLVGDATNLFPQNLCSYTSSDKVQPFVSSYSTGTSKTKNTSTFRIGAPIFFYASWTEKAKGSNYPPDNTMALANNGISLQYSTNCGTTLTLNKPVYLVGIPSGSTYTLADTWWTQTLPSTEDGKIYILLGYTYSNYQISWQPFHPIYWYKNGGIELYSSSAGSVTSVTINATSPIAVDDSSAITSSGTRTLSHANSGVTAGTYKSVTVNATGHVTAGTNPTTLSGYGITDAKIASGVITLGSNTITPLTASSTLDATKLSGTIPSGCYTDTKNTAGSTDSSSKLFLIGATSQAANPQTYSQDTAYVGTDGKLYSNSKEVVNLSDSQALTNKTYNGYTLADASAKGVVTSVDTSADLPTSNAVKTFVEGKGYITSSGSITGNAATATTLQAYTYNRNNNTNTWFKVATVSFRSTYQEKHAYLFIKGTHNSNYKQNGIVAIDAVGNATTGAVGSYAAQFMSATDSLDLTNFYIEYKNGDADNDAVVNFWLRANTNGYASWQIKILQNSGWTIASSSPTATTLPSTGFTGKNAERVGYALKADSSTNAANASRLIPVCAVGSDVADTNGWYKVATSTLSGYGNQNLLYFIKGGYTNGYAGILELEVRSDSSAISCWKLNWVARHPNFTEGNVIIVISGMTWTMYAYQPSSRYGRLYFTELSNRSINGGAPTWTITYFDGNDTKEASKPTPTVSSTDGWTVASSKTANQLTTGRTIALGTGATGTATSFNGTANITIPVTDVKDSYVTWGGKGLTNNALSPGDMGCVDEFGHNKLAYLPASCIDVAYSTDGGTTWTDYGLTDAQKVSMVTTSFGGAVSGGSTAATSENVTQHKLRIRIACGTTDGTLKIYTAAKKILFDVTDPGSNAKLHMRYRTIANYKSSTDTWEDISTDYDVRGGNGWNSIPFVYTFGGNMSTQTTQIGQFEFVFSNTQLGTWGNKKVSVLNIRLIGASNWTMPSELARAGHLYNIDTDQNALFPGNILPKTNNAKTLGNSSYKWNNVYATTFTGNLTGNVTGNLTGTASKATGDKNGNDITTTYQPTLVSGTNIKTINNTSLLGSGNIDIQGGGTANIENAWNCTCTTAASTATKVVTCSEAGFSLQEGTIIAVSFTNTNTASSVKLNVNSGGAVSIGDRGAAYTGNDPEMTGYAGRILYYCYDGTYWNWLNIYGESLNAVNNAGNATNLAVVASGSYNPADYPNNTIIITY